MRHYLKHNSYTQLHIKIQMSQKVCPTITSVFSVADHLTLSAVGFIARQLYNIPKEREGEKKKTSGVIHSIQFHLWAAK